MVNNPATTIADNEHPKVKLLRQRLAGQLGIQSIYQLQRIAGAALARGQFWRSNGSDTPTNTEPQIDNDPILSSTIDTVGPLVRQLDGRLRVDIWNGYFTTPEGQIIAIDDPILNEHLRLSQSLYTRWVPRSGIREWYADLSFRRVIAGSAIARWRFPKLRLGASQEEKRSYLRTCGLRLDWSPHSAVSLDPMFPIPEINRHTWAIDSQALSVEQAAEQYGSLLEEKGASVTSGTPLRDLIRADNFVNSSISAGFTGVSESETRGVLVHEMFDQNYRWLTIILENPEWTDRSSRKHPIELHVLYDGPWEYGCPFLKLDCYKNPDRAIGDSFPLSLAGAQNIVTVLTRMHLRGVWVQAMMKWLVAAETLIDESDEEALTSDEFGAVVHFRRNAGPASSLVAPLQVNRYDAAADHLIGMAQNAMERSSAVTPILQGESSNREPNASYQTRLQQALVPLESLSQLDKRRSEEWAANAAEANGRNAGLYVSRKTFVSWAGKRFAGMALDRKRMKRIVDAGPVALHLRDDAFAPKPREVKHQELMQLAVAGHIDPRDPWFQEEVFLQTGWEAESGQADAFHAAMTVVGRVLDGENLHPGPSYPLAWIIRIASGHVNTGLLSGYSKRQIADLQLLISDCEIEQHQAVLTKAATQSAMNALGGSQQGGPLQGGPPMMGAPGAGPSMGGPVVGQPVMVGAV
jgi:hypothetical protein